MKQLWMLVGGNGAGKSTFFKRYLEPRGVQFVNADNIAKRLDQDHPEERSYQAAKIAEIIRLDLLHKGISFCFESVFSHPSKIDFMAEAKTHGYQIILVFIHLVNDEINQARVKQRVSEGGHDVPAEKIITRIPRTLQHVRLALALSDEAYILDNSTRQDPYRLVSTLQNGKLSMNNPAPDWAQEVLSDYLVWCNE
jgi:predicted ABC-type ATPase